MIETKDIIALVLMAIGLPIGTALCCLSSRFRDLMFFLLIVTAVVPDILDINFNSRYWYYRGTTRGFEVAFGDIIALCLLLASVLAPRPGQKRILWPASLGFCLLYFAYCAFSVAHSEPKIFGAFELTKVFRGILMMISAASFVRSERELKILVMALACVLYYEGLICIKQRYLNGIVRVEGTVYHPNSLSMYLGMTAPLVMAAAFARYPAWLRNFCLGAVGLSFLTIVLTISRMGIPMFILVVGGATLFSMRVQITPKKIIAGLGALAAAAVLFGMSWDTIKSRYGEATLEDEYVRRGTESRGLYLRLAQHIVHDHFEGVGLGNWSYAVSKTYGEREGQRYENYDKLNSGPEPAVVESSHYAAPAHNLGALTVGELGIPGLVLFALMWVRWFTMGVRFLWKRTSDPVRRIGIGMFFSLVGVFLQSVTEWTFRQTPIFLTFHMLIGTLAGLYVIRRHQLQRERDGIEEETDWEESDESRPHLAEV